MEYQVKTGDILSHKTAALVVGVFAGKKMAGHAAQAADAASGGALSRLLRKGDLEGKAGQSATLYDLKGIAAERLVVIGLGDNRSFDRAALAKALGPTIKSIAASGARYVLCGHSERRAKHGETDEQVAEQARAALQAGLRPIVCVGETPEQRAQERQEQAVREQMENLPLHSIDLTIAYEPVWAIGEKALRAATSQEAQQMHQFIRSLFDPQRRDLVRIIYGGNVNTKNAQGLFDQPDIDGALVGGASLKPIEFQEIVEKAAQ